MSITALTIATAADEYAITLAEAKSHLRITHGAEDDHIQSLIAAANDWAQTYMRRILVDSQVQYRFDKFPGTTEQYYLGYSEAGYQVVRKNIYSRNNRTNSRDRAIFLPGGKVTAINDIEYIDVNSAPQTLTGATSGTPGTDYQEDLTDDEWPFAYPPTTGDWPGVADGVINAVMIDYQVGWPVGEAPESIKHAIKFKVADMFTIRDTADAGSKSQLLQAAENLLDPYVVPFV
jgi:hypothetical protein